VSIPDNTLFNELSIYHFSSSVGFASLKDVGFNWGVLLGLAAVYFLLAVVSAERQYNNK